MLKFENEARDLVFEERFALGIEVRNADLVIDGVGAGEAEIDRIAVFGWAHRLDAGFDRVVFLFEISFDIDFHVRRDGLRILDGAHGARLGSGAPLRPVDGGTPTPSPASRGG